MSLLGHSISRLLGEATHRKTASIGLENAKANRKHVRYTVKDLPPPPKGDSCIVIGAGPSLKRAHSIRKIVASGYGGTLIACDGSLPACLRRGLIPDYVVTLDAHPERIIRWFGDPKLATRSGDDYFKRQDLDVDLNGNETHRNAELLELVNNDGWRIKALPATSVAPEVADRCIAAGMQTYWWTPLYDDPDGPESVARQAYEITKAPCVVTGGNVGSAAWVIAHSILGKRNIGLVGMDLGYAPGTPHEKTQYYHEMKALLGEHFEEGFIPCKDGWYTDPTYFWYRECLLKMLPNAPAQTYNCTEGGILTEEDMPCLSLDAFLRRFS